jgi:hypothetical protein
MARHTSLVLFALIAGSMAAAPAAQAIVLDWDYTVSSVFTAATYEGPPGGESFSASEISWGDPAGSVSPGGGRSAIGISNSPAMGSVDTNDGPGLGNVFTHFNNVVNIDDFAHLDTASVTSTFTLTPTATSGEPIPGAPPPFVVDFVIDFEETDNAGPCSVGDPPCPDIFVLETGVLNQSFQLDSVTYFLSIFEFTNQLTPLPDEACLDAGAPTPCIGFITAEGEDTAAQFALVITTEPIGIPEPFALSLFGLGLIALGAARRRAA